MELVEQDIRQGSSYFAGRWQSPDGRKQHEIVDSGNTLRVVSRYALATAEDAATAVEAAREAFPGWAETPAPERMEYVHRLIELWQGRQDALAEIVTLEMGKPLVESRSEANRAINEMRFVAGEAFRLSERTFPSARRNVDAYIVRQPVGVIVAITPWNFPILSPIRKVVPALVYGCPVVLKPALEAPGASVMLAEMLEEAGLPPGVMSMLVGRGSEVGQALTSQPGVAGVTFTGSTGVGLALAKQAAGRNLRVQLEMGGKNGAVVTGCSDVEGAAEEIVTAAFTTSGQRCTALSRVIVTRDQQEELESALVREIEKISVGHGLDESTKMGPLVNHDAIETSARYVRQAVDDGARVLVGGDRLEDGALSDGHFFSPTLVTDVRRGTPPAVDEIFGPVLVVVPVNDFHEALEVHNEPQYGLTSSVFTDDMDIVNAFVRKAEAGMVHVNHGTVSEGHLPFGGVKNSGKGPYGIGDTNRDFFTERKVVYHKYNEIAPPVEEISLEEQARTY